jgi:hypothetical protein
MSLKTAKEDMEEHNEKPNPPIVISAGKLLENTRDVAGESNKPSASFA